MFRHCLNVWGTDQMLSSLNFTPLIPTLLILIAAVVIVALTAFALWRVLAGWWLRGLAALVLLVALAEPSWKQEDRNYLSDIVLVIVDESASQKIDIRPDQMAEAEQALKAKLASLQATAGDTPLEVRTVTLSDSVGPNITPGTRILTALSEAAAEISADRIAAAILLTDGQVHDAEALQDFVAPVHVVLTGREDEWDRRILLETAPSFAIIGESVELTLKVETLGNRVSPERIDELVPLLLSINGEPAKVYDVPLNESVTIPLEIDRGGMNVLQITVPAVEGELTERNNTAIISVNGIRDRLRVLLVSGEPYAGERTWRNLLKSDSAVDLVHFTILRPPEKQDGVPVFELSLIAFPTRELFMDKVDEFDLIIFDRYRRRGVLPKLYIENIARYIRDGGAVLIASGPSFAGAESLYRTPLMEVLPAKPTARVLEEGFVPRISDIGERHPVTRGLTSFAPRPTEADGTPGWGRWFRLIDMDAISGHVVMEGPEKRPLLVLDRVGEGRIAMLASDHAWLWSRGFEGGGPQSELLRRLAHWLMKEPELEEEVLVAEPNGSDITITRRSLGDTVSNLNVISPSGIEQELPFTEIAPGEWQVQFTPSENGFYRMAEGDTTAVTAIGPAAPREFVNPLSTAEILSPLAEETGGGISRFSASGLPDIRRVREGRVASGRNWIGLERREAYDVRDIRLTPLAPGWLMLLLAASLIFVAWRVEGR